MLTFVDVWLAGDVGLRDDGFVGELERHLLGSATTRKVEKVTPSQKKGEGASGGLFSRIPEPG
jgi:hypothetical protein